MFENLSGDVAVHLADVNLSKGAGNPEQLYNKINILIAVCIKIYYEICCVYIFVTIISELRECYGTIMFIGSRLKLVQSILLDYIFLRYIFNIILLCLLIHEHLFLYIF